MSETDTALDPLADLGFGGVATDAGVTNAVGAAEDTGKTRAQREEVEIGELEFGFADFIPSLTRTGGGSKYEFDKLVAPKLKDEADPSKGYNYAVFTVKKLEDVQAAALKRSVQSAVTGENRKQKKDGTKIAFVSRSIVKNGEFIGMMVFRVDDTLGGTAE